MSSDHPCVIIGIAGASASGKSLIASTIFHELKKELGRSEIAVIKEDSYYRDQSHLSMDERVKTNYDHPNAFEHELLIQHLKDLQGGKAVAIPEYCYENHTRKQDVSHRLEPKKVIILEGILLLSHGPLRDMLQASIFVDAPLDICLTRRLRRDVAERGRTMESVLKQYKETVRPMFMQFIEPSKQYADIIIPRGGKNRIAIDMLKARILQHL